uniref:Uncharacterized protein n=1 Tax=Anguilla anguilla TaxID=7936 RepID=A0A0E9PFI1_ANGAN
MASLDGFNSQLFCHNRFLCSFVFIHSNCRYFTLIHQLNALTAKIGCRI